MSPQPTLHQAQAESIFHAREDFAHRRRSQMTSAAIPPPSPPGLIGLAGRLASPRGGNAELIRERSQVECRRSTETAAYCMYVRISRTAGVSDDKRSD